MSLDKRNMSRKTGNYSPDHRNQKKSFNYYFTLLNNINLELLSFWKNPLRKSNTYSVIYGSLRFSGSLCFVDFPVHPGELVGKRQYKEFTF